jgi:hypothetical protein
MDNRPDRLDAERADVMRRRYVAAPGSTVSGLAAAFGVSWVAAYEILAGVAVPGDDLIQYRIKYSAEIGLRTLARVLPEPEIVRKYAEVKRRERDETRVMRARAKHPPLPRLVGASVSKASRAAWARRRAGGASPPEA